MFWPSWRHTAGGTLLESEADRAGKLRGPQTLFESEAAPWTRSSKVVEGICGELCAKPTSLERTLNIQFQYESILRPAMTSSDHHLVVLAHPRLHSLG